LIARISILVLAIFLFSCESKNTDELNVEDTLSPEKMIEILTDIHIVEGAKIGRKIMGDTLMMDAYYQKVFSKYQIDKKQFEANYRYYSSEPKRMDDIYEKVVENLNQLQISVPKWDEMEALNGENDKRSKDSIESKSLLDSLMKDSSFIDRQALKNLRPLKTQEAESDK
tara:strand:- start:122111 stop:122620 length:510 start_codon:yes stop_codon:yes gene_type:complete